MRFILFIFFFFHIVTYADNYELGHGYRVDKALNVGAYFSVDYAKGTDLNTFRLDDVAVLFYGDIFSSKLSYMLELEAAPFYTKNFINKTSQTDTTFHYERIYVNYMYSEKFNFRLGKQITPIGYWNLEPINVLRDTSSNPMYSYLIFPKLFTGLDTNGYIDADNSIKYHLFAQVSDDIDENYINIKNDFFVGGSLEQEFSYELSYGASLAYYETKEEDSDVFGKKDIVLFAINAKYDNYPYKVQTEWAYSEINHKLIEEKNYIFGGYTQGVYNLNYQHAFIARYEYFDDNKLGTLNHIGLIGYSYRPVYSVSFKAEYQLNSDAQLSKFLTSFSVLF